MSKVLENVCAFFIILKSWLHKASFFVGEWFGWTLIFLWGKSLSYRNQSIDLFSKSMDWFLYDRDLRHERVKVRPVILQYYINLFYATGFAWKVSKHRVFSGPYFPVFGLNTGKYGPEETPYLDISRSAVFQWF